MTEAGTLAQVRQVIEEDQVALPTPAQAMAGAIRTKHGPAVRAMIFYGSALREGEAAEKMLDFYVIVKNYRVVYGWGLKSLGAWLLPPNVHFMGITDARGAKLRSKYAVISEAAFMRRASGGSLESMLWARFSQPVVIVVEDPVLRARLIEVLARACRHFAAQVTPLLNGPLAPGDIWQRGLHESYRTELRPESSGPRAAEIVARFPGRYARLSQIVVPQGELPDVGRLRRGVCRAKWALRRIIGKPLGVLRVLKAATTFDAGLDYILEKVASHSGVELEVSAAERRHPVLHAPKLAWRLWRAGAFR